jgi:hypothetical protein
VTICSSSANRTKALTGSSHKRYIYNTVIRAIIESALIVWIGLLTYAIATTHWFALGTANTNDPSLAMVQVSRFLNDGAMYGRLISGTGRRCIDDSLRRSSIHFRESGSCRSSM